MTKLLLLLRNKLDTNSTINNTSNTHFVFKAKHVLVHNVAQILSTTTKLTHWFYHKMITLYKISVPNAHSEITHFTYIYSNKNKIF